MRLILEAGIDPDAEGSQAQSSPVTVAVIERRDFSLPQLGLGLAEGRALLAEVQTASRLAPQAQPHE